MAKGQRNVFAVKVTPERLIQDVDGVELADSWFDWLNWKYMGYHGSCKPDSHGISFVPDRNAGIWKPVYLKVSGEVGIEHPYRALGRVVVPESASVPERGASAKLTMYSSVRNFSDRQVAGVLRGAISRPESRRSQSNSRSRLRRANRAKWRLHRRNFRSLRSAILICGGRTRWGSRIFTICSWSL